MSTIKLDAILESHFQWLIDENKGCRADLSYADLCFADLSCADLRDAALRNADLSCADLRGADLCGTNLSYADLRGAALRNADLHGADLCGTNLSYADLRGADLCGTNLSYADLRGADLRDADLRGADLHGADLRDVDLHGADLRGADLRYVSGKQGLAATEIVPREGSFVGWKKCRDDALVKLVIPWDAKRSNATGRKCRASKVEVVEIASNGKPAEVCFSIFDSSFAYRVGDVIEVENFDDDRFKECVPGIHFFLTPEEAMAY